MTSTWQVKCSNSMYFHNSVLHGGWPCDSCQGQSIEGEGHKLKAKAMAIQSQGQDYLP